MSMEDNGLNLYEYNPYKDLKKYLDDEYFEDKFLEYLNKFKERLLNYKYDSGKDLSKEFSLVIRQRNDEMINLIINDYTTDREDNEKCIIELKKKVRKIKDIVLATEEPDMRRLQNIDDRMGELIDRCSSNLGILNDEEIDLVFESFLSNSLGARDMYDLSIRSLRNKVSELCYVARKNYSVKTASKMISELNKRLDKTIKSVLSYNDIHEDNVINMGIILEYEHYFNKYVIDDDSYNVWLDEFKCQVEYLKKVAREIYPSKMAKKMCELIDDRVNGVLDRCSSKMNYPEAHDMVLNSIFDSYKPEELDIFNLELYSSEDERNNAIKKYNQMTDEEKIVFETRMYEEYIRRFKRRVREFNKELRRVYSKKSADKKIDYINKKADRLIIEKAKVLGKPVPSNPWIIRKNLWADTTNFISEDDVKFKKIINPFMREIIKLGMKNKIIIEERGILDPTKQYLFVSTHYFTEDVIGLFSSVGRQAYMVMGTTDQIENNPLMFFAMLLGFLHVDRMDSMNRQECFEKQNEVIEHGTNVINYIGGSWENSENELQPLSFSGPYKTSVLKNVEIVPVASYLVKEKNEMYVRFGEPMDLSKCDLEEANDIIRDTLASMHYKQLEKYSTPIGSVYVKGYGITHDLPYDQHTYYMDQIGNEYWNQPWSKPFAKEEIGVRRSKYVTESEVYDFIDNLSREKLIELSGRLGEPLVRMDEKERYDIIDYLDRNYDSFRENNGKKRTKKKNI